ncbi:uncharacterized protein ALTATR162_LOCUS10671 [Alternaria atra]|uniref:F-box domain-containing protein n=1 Tax=Alternaria atra TaxID=119953 RepID=A0A8J2IEH3_9PLEO|nr:uncharacterized protein ALTATR162_LOCUS10671 [Alternaria atra]CAG5183619.1 unnamed protein product [Alternaria atra]
MESSDIDFAELADGYANGLIFATSLCGRFLCVARETLIYIYVLERGVPVPITSVVCPRRALEMKMDVSSGRHTIVALLEGRMGLVCELQYGRTVRGNGPVEVHVDIDGPERGTTSASIQTSCVNDYETGTNFQGRSMARTHRLFVQERDPASSDTISFPLTAPSDHLYFLSPRPGFESAKKLRLISSAAHPEDRPAISRKLFGRPTMSAFWGSFGFESTSHRPGSPSCDHYRAIPLSDGYHILFIDPSTGLLKLSCDAPLGGPTNLLRKITLVPPEQNMVPRLYSAAADLSQGVRIVVTYGDSLVLYSIPPDVIQLSQMEQNAKCWDAYNASTNPTLRRQRDHWLNYSIWPLAIRGTEVGRLAGVCELAIQTQPEILVWAFTHTSKCKTWRLCNYIDPVLVDKSLVCRNGIVHDAFSVNGSGDVIMTDASHALPINGSIDLHVTGEDTEIPQAERSVLVGFDGNSSGILKRIPKALAVENDEWVDYLDARGCSEARYQANGDVNMWYGTRDSGYREEDDDGEIQ